MTVSSERPGYQELNLFALGLGLSAALVVLYVLFWLAVFIVPGLAHGWLALFSTEAAGSVPGLIAGIIGSVILGWMAAGVLGSVYNAAIRW